MTEYFFILWKIYMEDVMKIALLQLAVLTEINVAFKRKKMLYFIFDWKNFNLLPEFLMSSIFTNRFLQGYHFSEIEIFEITTSTKTNGILIPLISYSSKIPLIILYNFLQAALIDSFSKKIFYLIDQRKLIKNYSIKYYFNLLIFYYEWYALFIMSKYFYSTILSSIE